MSPPIQFTLTILIIPTPPNSNRSVSWIKKMNIIKQESSIWLLHRLTFFHLDTDDMRAPEGSSLRKCWSWRLLISLWIMMWSWRGSIQKTLGSYLRAFRTPRLKWCFASGRNSSRWSDLIIIHWRQSGVGCGCTCINYWSMYFVQYIRNLFETIFYDSILVSMA